MRTVQAKSIAEMIDDLTAHMLNTIEYAPADGIETDGELYRFDTMKQNDKAGWYVCHITKWGIVATFGDWREGVKHQWNSFNPKSLSKRDLAELKRIQAEQHAAREKAKTARQAQAAQQAFTMWSGAGQVNPKHPYLTKKGIYGDLLKQTINLLLVPMTNLDGHLYNIQTIAPDGTKRFLAGGRKKGLFMVISSDGKLIHERPAQTVICEGFATGESYFNDHPNDAVLVAFDAGNLLHVATAYRTRYIHADLAILADNDRKTKGNPGVSHAKAAAAATGASVIIPEFPMNAPAWATDYNDFVTLYGSQANGGAA